MHLSFLIAWQMHLWLTRMFDMPFIIWQVNRMNFRNRSLKYWTVHKDSCRHADISSPFENMGRSYPANSWYHQWQFIERKRMNTDNGDEFLQMNSKSSTSAPQNSFPLWSGTQALSALNLRWMVFLMYGSYLPGAFVFSILDVDYPTRTKPFAEEIPAARKSGLIHKLVSTEQSGMCGSDEGFDHEQSRTFLIR